LCIVAGGHLAGRFSGHGVLSGAYTGMLSAVLNMLILGAVVSESMSSAGLWVPGMLVGSGLLGLAGALTGVGSFRPAAPPPNWTTVFAGVAIWTTFLLVFWRAYHQHGRPGCVDWPNTEGQLMFLYPLAKMTGGIFYEHSHRLLGSLVGLTMLTLAIHLSCTALPRWVKSLAWGGFILVVLQGLLGGLRVTGVFTASTDPADTAPNIFLAIVHGVVGQVFLALLVALAVFNSGRWLALPRPDHHPSASFDRSLSLSATVLLIVQLVLGAIQRHIAGGLHIHITLAVILILAVLTLGVRLWGIYTASSLLQRTGIAPGYRPAQLLRSTLVKTWLWLGWCYAASCGYRHRHQIWRVLLADCVHRR
jgi:cytochrome c oxidase assembly protein subunit 15